MSDPAIPADELLAWLWANAFTVAGAIIAVAAFILVPFRRSPAEARSWLLIFFALPWLALLVYALIGRPHYARKRQESYAELPAMLARIAEQAGLDAPELVPALCSDNRSVANLARGLGQFGAATGNRIAMLSDYDETCERIVADIDRARHHVHLQTYIFVDDRVGDRIMAALERASARGVECRVLIDALGSYGSIKAIKRRLQPRGIAVRDILPLRRRWTSSRVDLRNHRKIIVIDGEIGYTGSQNIWDPTQHRNRANRDLMLRITGPVAIQLQAIFVTDWYLETHNKLADARLYPRQPAKSDPAEEAGLAAQVLASGPDNPQGGVDLVVAQAIHNAAEEIVIVTPYFIPNDALLAAIRGAVIRGVRVCLITTRRSDQRLVGLAQRSYYADLLASGVEVYLHGPDFLHAKHLRVDHEVAIIGSSNMDVRSFELNAEIDLLCYDAALAARLQALENSYLASAVRLSAQDWQQRPIGAKIVENSARLMSDLI